MIKMLVKIITFASVFAICCDNSSSVGVFLILANSCTLFVTSERAYKDHVTCSRSLDLGDDGLFALLRVLSGFLEQAAFFWRKRSHVGLVRNKDSNFSCSKLRENILSSGSDLDVP
jgi:hypothetical protein